jgi:hypothetical protein
VSREAQIITGAVIARIRVMAVISFWMARFSVLEQVCGIGSQKGQKNVDASETPLVGAAVTRIP